MMHTTYIDMIRHGEPEGGLVFRGTTDHALTERGHQQFATRIAMQDTDWQVIISSPLRRCLESAQALATTRSLPLHIMPDFSEIHFGTWENRLVADVMAEQNIQQMWENPLSFCAPQGEPTQQLQQRAMAAWEHTIEQHRGQRILIVTHGGIMRVLAHHLLALNESSISKLSLPYAAFMRFKLIENHYQGEPQQWLNLIQLCGEDI